MKVKINNKSYNFKFKNELTILQACEMIDIHIPRFCYHEKLAIAGNCRMCFVELPKAKKPIVACSTPIQENLEVYTNTFVVKKAQESVLEFLLVNHPLDCPICDQGGECDLQELTKNFGSDRGRYAEIKRSVEDINLGPVIKTIMTRCIHCTRCIRFATEILDVPVLGTAGRGKDTEVSTYIKKSLSSELSGNIVDLCPVGALTSRPYAFKARPWELSNVESFDVLDFLGSSIRLDHKNQSLFRVLPRLNDILNEEWITDKIRYSFDALSLQRLTVPSMRVKKLIKGEYLTKLFINCSWDYLLKFYTRYLLYKKSHSFLSLQYGKLVDLNTVILSKITKNLLSIPLVEGSSHSNIRNDFLLEVPLKEVESSESFFAVGLDLNSYSPIFNLKVKKNSKNKNIIVIGSKWNNKLKNSKQYSNNISSIAKIVEGRSFMNYYLYNTDKIVFLYTTQFKLGKTEIYKQLRSNIQRFKNLYEHVWTGSIVLYNMYSHQSDLNLFEIGGSPRMYNMTTSKKANNFSNNILINLEDHLGDKFSISGWKMYIGHHLSPLNNETYDLYLPCTSFIEKRSYYINNIGNICRTNKIGKGPGKSMNTSKIMLKLIKYLSGSIFYEKLKKNYREIIRKYMKQGELLKYNILIFTNYSMFPHNHYNMNISSIPSKLFYYYYCSDLFSLNSPLMHKLTKEQKKMESTFYFNTKKERI